MGVTLEELRRLQAVEMQLAAIQRNRESKAHQVEIRRRQVRLIDEKLQENHRKARECQMRLDALSLDVTAREDSVSRHRLALNKAKTNKEYAAILAAMNTEKADATRQEGDTLKLMDEMGALRAAGDQLETQRQKAIADVATAEAALARQDDQSSGDMVRLQASRDGLAAQVVPGALAIFTRIAERHDGEALVPVIKPYPKREDFACSGCNMKLTLDIINSLRTRDDIQICQVCGRIQHFDSTQLLPSRQTSS